MPNNYEALKELEQRRGLSLDEQRLIHAKFIDLIEAKAESLLNDQGVDQTALCILAQEMVDAIPTSVPDVLQGVGGI